MIRKGKFVINTTFKEPYYTQTGSITNFTKFTINNIIMQTIEVILNAEKFQQSCCNCNGNPLY